MLRRRLLAPAVALVAALAFAGCTGGGGAPTPTPTTLTEEQAYAAAEDAFRAYIDALNEIDLADPSTFEPAFALTTGRLNADDRRKYSEWHADKWIETGDVVTASVDLDGSNDERTEVDLAICLDASAVQLTDHGGVSQINADRPEVAPVRAVVLREDEQWRVERIVLREGETC